jgi:hypothetical protein
MRLAPLGLILDTRRLGDQAFGACLDPGVAAKLEYGCSQVHDQRGLLMERLSKPGMSLCAAALMILGGGAYALASSGDGTMTCA